MFVDFAGRALGYTIDDIMDEFVRVRTLKAKMMLGAKWTVAPAGKVNYMVGTGRMGQRRQTSMKFFMLEGLDRRHTAAQMKTLLLALDAADITHVGGYVAQSQAMCNYTMSQTKAMHTFMTAIGAAEVTHMLLDLGDPKERDEKYRARAAGVKRQSRHECGLVAVQVLMVRMPAPTKSTPCTPTGMHYRPDRKLDRYMHRLTTSDPNDPDLEAWL